MLGEPKKLPTRGGHGYLVSWKDRIRTATRAQAETTVAALLEDPMNVEALRRELGHDGPVDELREWIVAGLANDGAVLFFAEPERRVFDPAQVTDLVDLLPPDTGADLESLTFEVYERGRKGVEVRYRVSAPGDESSGVLAPGGRRSVNRLEPTSQVAVEFSGVQLSLPERVGQPRPDERGCEPPQVDGGRKADGANETDAVPSPDAQGSMTVSMRASHGNIEAVDAPVALGEAAPCASDELSFTRLVLSIPQRQQKRQ